MKTMLNLIITCLVIVLAWQVEVNTDAKEPNLNYIVIVPFLITAIYARLNIKEIKL